MQKKLIVAAVAALSMMGAHAGGNSNNSDVYNTTNNNQTYNQGGQGGYANGGAGGSGIGVGVGIGAGGAGGAGGQGGSVVGSGNSSAVGTGGSVVGSGNSSATGGSVKNDNTNQQGQLQGQLQGQQQGQGQSQSNKSSNRNDNRSNASNQNSNANSGNNAQTSVSVQGDNVSYQAAKIPVATAYAAGLTASNGTCMGSTSAGVQGMSVGVSIGSTWKDSGCDRRYNAQALAAVGQAKAAVALLCQDSDIKAAMEVAGTPCADVKAIKVSAVQEVEIEALAKSEPLDALVRSRIGLPPLTK